MTTPAGSAGGQEAGQAHGALPGGHAQRDQELLWHDVLGLAGFVETALRTAIDTLNEGRGDLVAEVRAEEAEVDRWEVRIEKACLRVLALYEPVAFDLRRIIAALRINRELERLADIAESLAKRAPKLRRDPVADPHLTRIGELGRQVVELVDGTLQALRDLDPERARAMIEAAPAVSRARRRLTGALKARLQAQPEHVGTWLRLLSSARNLGRAGKHVSQIAAAIVYLKEGTPPDEAA